MWWHRGRCLSYGEGVAFWALAEIVRQRLGIAEEDPADAAAAKLTDGLDQYVTDPGERGYVGVRLGRLLGVAAVGDSGEALSREELFAGWRLFFERLAVEKPVVLLVEDAQYADTGLLDFLDHLINWTRDLPVYVLVFARPELGQARPGLGTGRNRNTLTLDPLDAASMDQLVEALVPGMPAKARAKITGEAQGIPLFAVETVRALIDRDIVQPTEGVYRLTGDIGELAVPDSLHALLAARLDALVGDARRLVAERGSVLGTTFPAEALIVVSRQTTLGSSADRTGRAGSPRGVQRVRRPAVAGAGQLKVRPGHAAPGRVRYLVAAGPQGPPPGGGRAPRSGVPRRGGGGGRGHRPALPGRAGGCARRPRHRADPRAGGRRSDPAGERAERTGAPARAAAIYAAAADLTLAGPPGAPVAAGLLWERAATAADTSANWALAVELARPGPRVPPAGRAGPRCGPRPGHRRAGAVPVGRLAEAREQLTAAVEVLRADPDNDTVRALHILAEVEVFAGSPDAGRLSAEALSLGQALGVGDGDLSRLFSNSGIYFAFTDRRAEAAAYHRESARLAARPATQHAPGTSLGQSGGHTGGRRS